MKIVRAMKETSRIKGEIKEIKKRISKCLNTLEGNEVTEKFDDLMKLLDERTNTLISLKTRIMAANVAGDKFELIVRLGELKSRMDFIRELDPKKGLQVAGYNDTQLRYSSQWSDGDKNKALQMTQNEINRLTDALDDFNSTVDIAK
jgi:archaellum component FlaC